MARGKTITHQQADDIARKRWEKQLQEIIEKHKARLRQMLSEEYELRVTKIPEKRIYFKVKSYVRTTYTRTYLAKKPTKPKASKKVA